jgi:hypothetical protein
MIHIFFKNLILDLFGDLWSYEEEIDFNRTFLIEIIGREDGQNFITD